MLASIAGLGPAIAQASATWNGVWTGSWGGIKPCSVMIVSGKVARYENDGKPVPVTLSKIDGDTITFGVAEYYAIRIIRTGPNTATAPFENFRDSKDVSAADLTRK